MGAHNLHKVVKALDTQLQSAKDEHNEYVHSRDQDRYAHQRELDELEEEIQKAQTATAAYVRRQAECEKELTDLEERRD